ncbi:MFS transporter [Clostridium fungisolvens]|uniref:Enterobactin exporter EntS n=1 Tax=Clostridium fungisolvens TaxID=1604897 RepID=A0A6V8SMT9_9CLOT|nr:MFS transporter [Clostridium fungisolvens]GFP78086.1 Enterobactin exporter EntS [Clostridium fungisolvens]
MEQNTDISLQEEKIKIGYKDLLKEKQFLKNTIANSVSRFGDGIDTIAFSWLVYQVTGSTALVAALFAVNGLPNLLFGMVSGVASNYFKKKHVMAICDLGRGLCVSLISLLFITGNLRAWHLYVVTFFNSSFEAFRGPASTAASPLILPKEKFDVGTSLSSSLTNTLQIIGLTAAPLFIAILGVGGAILIDACTFFVCGFIVLTLKYTDYLKKNTDNSPKVYLNDLKEGFSYVIKDSFVLSICIFGALVNVFMTPLNAFQAPYAKDVLNRGSEVLSFIEVPILIAMSLGVLFIPKVKEKIGGRLMLLSGTAIVGLTYSTFALLGHLPAYLLYPSLAINSFLLGLGAILVNMPLQISLFTKIDREYLSRVASIMNALMLCATPLGSFIFGMISSVVSIKLLFFALGIVVIILSLTQTLNKALKGLN